MEAGHFKFYENSNMLLYIKLWVYNNIFLSNFLKNANELKKIILLFFQKMLSTDNYKKIFGFICLSGIVTICAMHNTLTIDDVMYLKRFAFMASGTSNKLKVIFRHDIHSVDSFKRGMKNSETPVHAENRG